MPSLHDKFQGAIVGLAVGDALGRAVEFARTPEEIIQVSGPHGVEDLPTEPLVTDDTQMSCCIAEALLECEKKHDKFMESLTKYMIAWHKSQEDPLYNRLPEIGCMAACERLSMGATWFESGMAEGTMSNATAVRTAPIGLYLNEIPKLVEFGISSAQITHLDTVCQCGAVANAMVTMLALQDVPVGIWGHELMLPISGIDPVFDESIDYAAKAAATRTPAFTVLTQEYVGEGWFANDAIAGALFCCMREPNSFKNAVITAANTAGDSDSLACIVGGWMGARLGIKAIPKTWVDRVEDSQNLLELADRLYASRAK